jgi:hypothetical protein
MNRVFVCLALAAIPAYAAPGEGAYSLKLAGKSFDERCLKLTAGEAVRYRFNASAPVDFNIHYHRGSEVHYPVKTAASRSADATFTAPHADTYCLMWERKGDGAVRVDGSVERSPR